MDISIPRLEHKDSCWFHIFWCMLMHFDSHFDVFCGSSARWHSWSLLSSLAVLPWRSSRTAWRRGAWINGQLPSPTSRSFKTWGRLWALPSTAWLCSTFRPKQIKQIRKEDKRNMVFEEQNMANMAWRLAWVLAWAWDPPSIKIRPAYPNQHQSSNVLESTRLLRLLKTGRASRPSQLFWRVLLCSSLWCCLCLLSAKLRKSQRTCQPNNQRSKQRSRQGELGYPMWCCWHCWFLHWPQGWSSNFSPSSSSTSMACLLSRSAWFKPLSPWWRLASPTWWVFVLRWLVEPKPPVSVWSGSLDASLAYRYKERKERICYHHWLSSCSEAALPKHLLLLLGRSWWIAYLHPRGVDGAAAVPYLGSERSESVETMLNHD